MYEYVKTAVLAVTLLPLRIMCFGIGLLVIFVICKLGTLGLSTNARDESSGAILPYSRWRVVVLSAVPLVVRVWMALAFGIVWIRDMCVGVGGERCLLADDVKIGRNERS